MLDAIVLAAAQAIGGAKAALEITIDYAKTREQFGKPLGAFQSISHYLADAATSIEGGATLVYEAAWAKSQGKDTTLLAPMAKLFMCHAYRDVTATCQQVWGGVGFTIEYDIQLYFRRRSSCRCRGGTNAISVNSWRPRTRLSLAEGMRSGLAGRLLATSV